MVETVQVEASTAALFNNIPELLIYYYTKSHIIR